jgi:uncharacterized membrane protein YkoI
MKFSVEVKPSRAPIVPTSLIHLIHRRLSKEPVFMNLRRTVSAAALALSASVFAQFNPNMDYTSLPPEPTEVEQQLSAASLSLSAAISKAEQAAGGSTVDARAILQQPLKYEVTVSVGGVAKKVIVDGATGACIFPRLTVTEAAAIATKLHAGSVSSAGFDYSVDPATAIVDIYEGGKHFNVVINAIDGTVVADKEVPRFPGAATVGEATTMPDGLMFYDLVEGTGAMPEGKQSTVKVHYTGWLVDGTKFDSSLDRDAPAQFMLGGVIPGWTEGVGSMKLGGKRKLIIPFAIAYGERGRGPIPPKATLIFDVELLEITEPAAAPAIPGAPAPK